MALVEIFEKPINRSIEGVIKADDDTNLNQELEEYVITNEIEGKLENFLEAYNNYQNANGVWISGFFGSGKSHLLKMLSLVLENQSIEGDKALDIFIDKPAFKENTIFCKDMEKAASIPSQSILFNIASTADDVNTDQGHAILSVFAKVFDELCGYCSSIAYIADLERELDEADLFDSFKDKIKALTNQDWSFVRDRHLRFSNEVDSTYNKVTGQSKTNILETYSRDYSLSIEDFANRVNTYINTKEDNFRLNFFVDEVGQYIAGNIKLMLNLQSIAESLATKCKGRAWVIVTAQEEMKDVVGDMNLQQNNDFSKIQDRFKIRMNLTSQDVAEVIQKRLLLKNTQASNDLTAIYKKQQNNFATLFNFVDGAQKYKNYRDKEHFIYCYPFIPYQFGLFQETMQGLSSHSAFEGRHSSVGERSMLGVFRHVAIEISDYDIGELATFDLMFEGVRSILKGQIQNRILLAENELENPFAIRILKALFLVKWVKGIKTTLNNICVLMIDSFEHDNKALRKNVEEALDILEQQTYIKRKDDQYEYLSDEEKDIEEEIKSIEIESKDLLEELNEYVFVHIVRDIKIKYEGNKQGYSYNRKMDGILQGTVKAELSINVITPFNPDAGKSDTFLMDSMGLAELFVVMPADKKLLQNLQLYNKTNKYLRQNSDQVDPVIMRILSERGLQNNQLNKELINQIEESIAKSVLVSNGSKLDNITTADPKSKIIAGFNELIRNTYVNLEMLPANVVFSETDLSGYLDTSQGGLITDLSEAEQEILSLVERNNDSAMRTSYKSLIEHFEKKPYGWPLPAIQCLTAKLYAQARIEIRRDGAILRGNALIDALRSNRDRGHVSIDPQADFSPQQIRELKKFYEDYFDQPPASTDARNLGDETAQAFNNKIDQLKELSKNSHIFTFLEELNPVITTDLNEVKGKDYSWYLTKLPEKKDKLLKTKEELIDPIQRFMESGQKDIYLSAKSFIDDNQDNSHYIESDEFDSIKETLNDQECFKGDKIRNMEVQLDKVKVELAQIIKKKRDSEIVKVKKHKIRFEKIDGYNSLTQDQKEKVNSAYKNLKQDINTTDVIDVIPGKSNQFENEKYLELLDMLSQNPDKPQDLTKYISKNDVQVDFKALIESKQDLNDYSEKLKEAYLKELEAGNKIKL
jgi:hypothetical protein